MMTHRTGRRILSLLLAGALLPLTGCGALSVGGGDSGYPAKSDLLTEVRPIISPIGGPATPSPAEDGAAGQTDGQAETPPAGSLAAALAVELAEVPADAPMPHEDDYEKDGRFDYDAYSRDYDAFRTAVRARESLIGETTVPDAFLRHAAAQFLSGGEHKNRTCSPLNIYFALAMLAEVTDGDSRAQILQALGSEDLNALRLQTGKLWSGLYTDNGTTTVLPASSLWLNSQIAYREETLRLLADLYHASSFSGDMGTPEMDAALQDWLNDQTRGLLSEQAGSIRTDPLTVLALAATLYFKAPWEDSFFPGATQTDTFHARTEDVQVPFMRDSCHGTVYRYEGENAAFTAAAKTLEGGRMWFLLPDEGTDPDALLSSGAALDFLAALRNGNIVSGDYGEIHLTVPKFDVSSDFDLIKGLKAMGIADVFDGGRSDFTPLTRDAEELEVSKAAHAARVKIDEDGCEAAAFTVIMAEATAAMEPPPRIDFTLDRPFLFVVEGTGNVPLFLGVVENPAEM